MHPTATRACRTLLTLPPLAAGLRRAALAALLAAGVAGAGAPAVAAPAAEGPAAAPALTTERPRLVIASYFGWFGTPEGPAGGYAHWAGESGRQATHTPLTLYDSRDPGLIRRHVLQAQAAGIDAFAVYWTGSESRDDRTFEFLLSGAQDANATLQLAVMADVSALPARDPASVAAQLEGALQRHAGHPRYLKAEGRPVLFIVSTGAVSEAPAVWEAVLASPGLARFSPLVFTDQVGTAVSLVFPGSFTFNPMPAYAAGQLPLAYLNAAAHARAAGRYFAASVAPGYDDTAIRFPSANPVVPRDGGLVYRSTWEAALRARPDWVFVASWNDWNQGMEIEPSLEHRERYLDLTAQYARLFKATPW